MKLTRPFWWSLAGVVFWTALTGYYIWNPSGIPEGPWYRFIVACCGWQVARSVYLVR